MKRLMISLAVGMLGFGCGGSSVAIDTLMPAPTEIAGWSEDATQGGTGVEVARTPADAEGLIDGGAAPFTEHNFVAFAWQLYQKDNYRLDLRIWQFADAAKTATLYDDLLSNSLYSTATWTPDATMGDAARTADTGTSWWINARRKSYYIEAKMTTDPPAAPDATSQAEAKKFVDAVLSKVL